MGTEAGCTLYAVVLHLYLNPKVQELLKKFHYSELNEIAEKFSLIHEKLHQQTGFDELFVSFAEYAPFVQHQHTQKHNPHEIVCINTC